MGEAIPQNKRGSVNDELQSSSSCSLHQAGSTWREQGGCSTPLCASAVRVFQGMPLAPFQLCHHMLGTLQFPDTQPARGHVATTASLALLHVISQQLPLLTSLCPGLRGG